MKKDNVRNFFYNKNGGKNPSKRCFWMKVENKEYLVSYKTIVCSIDDRGKFEKYWDDYSVTTMNQINAFIGLFGKDTVMRSDTGEIINGFNKKEWMDMKIDYLDINVKNYIKPYMPVIEYENRYGVYVEKISYS